MERFFNRIKQFRGIASRYDKRKRPENYLAAKAHRREAMVSKFMSLRPSHPNPKFVS